MIINHPKPSGANTKNDEVLSCLLAWPMPHGVTIIIHEKSLTLLYLSLQDIKGTFVSPFVDLSTKSLLFEFVELLYGIIFTTRLSSVLKKQYVLLVH